MFGGEGLPGMPPWRFGRGREAATVAPTPRTSCVAAPGAARGNGEENVA